MKGHDRGETYAVFLHLFVLFLMFFCFFSRVSSDIHIGRKGVCDGHCISEMVLLFPSFGL